MELVLGFEVRNDRRLDFMLAQVFACTESAIRNHQPLELIVVRQAAPWRTVRPNAPRPPLVRRWIVLHRPRARCLWVPLATERDPTPIDRLGFALAGDERLASDRRLPRVLP